MSKKIQSLIKFNKIAAALHFAQAVLIIILSTDFAITVTQNYQTFNEETETLEATSRSLFDVQLAWLLAAFLFMSAIAHLYIAVLRPKWYAKNLKNGINKARWIEYSLSASTMIVAIGLLSGIEDFASLIMLFSLVAIMNLMGLVMEVVNQDRKKITWLPYNIGVLAGAIPWVVIAIYFWAADSASGAASIPTFVYVIYVSIFITFNLFAINMILQYKKFGKWEDYLYGERVYIWLSLIAKSALAWQVFAGTLRPM